MQNRQGVGGLQTAECPGFAVCGHCTAHGRGRLQNPLAHAVRFGIDERRVRRRVVKRGFGPVGHGLRAVGVLVEIRADAIGGVHAARERGVAKFADLRGQRGINGLCRAVAAEHAPVLFAAALAVGAEDEGVVARNALHLERDVGLGAVFGHNEFLSRRMGGEFWPHPRIGGRALVVRAAFRDPDGAVVRSGRGKRFALAREDGRIQRQGGVCVVVENVEVRRRAVREELRFVGARGRTAQPAVQDRHGGPRGLEAEVGRLERGGVVPNRFRREVDVRLVPELPVFHATVEGGCGFGAEAINRPEVAGQFLKTAGPRRAVVEAAGERDAALGKQVGGGKQARKVGRGVRRRLNLAPAHAFADVADAGERRQVGDGADGVAAVPRAVEGTAGDVGGGGIRGEEGGGSAPLRPPSGGTRNPARGIAAGRCDHGQRGKGLSGRGRLARIALQPVVPRRERRKVGAAFGIEGAGHADVAAAPINEPPRRAGLAAGGGDGRALDGDVSRGVEDDAARPV